MATTCKTKEKHGEVIKGKFRECVVKHKRYFAKGSYRWVRVDAKGKKKSKEQAKTSKHWLLVGCPIRKWNKRTKSCSGGRETHIKLTKIGRR